MTFNEVWKFPRIYRKNLGKIPGFSRILIYIVQRLTMFLVVILLAVSAGQVQLDNWDEHDT